jgi:alpha-L-arabinofuranosidase
MFGYNLYNCKGEYVALLCGDDYWTDENKLQQQWDFMSANSDYSFTYHALQRVLVQPDGTELKKEILTKHFYTNTVLFKNTFEYLPQAMFETLNEDIFIYHLIKYAGKVKYIENVKPTIQRIQDKGIWFSKNDELYKTKFRILTARKLLDAYRNTPIKEELRGGLLFQIVKGWETLKYTGGSEITSPNFVKFWCFLFKNNLFFKYLKERKSLSKC